MFLVLLAWCVGIGCVVVALRRLRVVGAIEREAIACEGLERASRERVLAKLDESSAQGRAAREVLEAPSRPAAIARLNEALGEVVREIDIGAEVPRSATRVALASGGLTGLLELARRLPAEGAASLPWALAAFSAGIVCAGVCLVLGQRAETGARRARDGWDRLSRILARLV